MGWWDRLVGSMFMDSIMGWNRVGCHSMMDLVTAIVIYFACWILRLKRPSSHMKSMQQTKVCSVDLLQSTIKTYHRMGVTSPSCIQWTIVKMNLASAKKSIEFAAKQGAALVVLPEMWNCPYSSDYFRKFAEDFKDKHGSPSFSMLSELAYIHSITIVGGSVPELDNNRLYNTCCVFGPNGKLLGKHRKLHLFDIVNTAPGELCFKESDSFAAGNKPTVVDTDMCRIGIGICHDIRFPELAMLYQARGVELICYPSAFNITTGSMLWELEQQARAIDNQIYIATCSPSRNSSGSYEIWGHSTLVAPGGEVVGKLEHVEGVLIAEIDLSAISHQRQCIPLQKHRRHDIYKLLEVEEQTP